MSRYLFITIRVGIMYVRVEKFSIGFQFDGDATLAADHSGFVVASDQLNISFAINAADFILVH